MARILRGNLYACLLALLLASAASAQSDFLQRIRSGIAGVARGMDQAGRKAGDLLGAGPRIGEEAASPYSETRTFEERYPTGAAPVVSISNEFGEIRVDTWNEQVVQVKAEIVAGADAAETAAQLAQAITVKVSPAEELVEIKTLLPETRRDMGHIAIAVRYHLTIPRAASLIADNFFGDVSAVGVGGLLGLEVQYGQVDIQQAGGAVRVRTHGEFPMTAKGLAQGGSFEMKGAVADIRDVSGDLKVNNFGGALKLAGLGAQLAADLTVDSGRVEIEFEPDATPDLTAAIVYGTLESAMDLTRSGQEERFVARRPNPGAHQRVTLNASFSDVVIAVRGAPAVPASGGAEGNVFNDTREERFTLVAGATINIDAAPGNVRVEGVDGDTVQVAATRVVWTPTAGTAPNALEALQLRVQQDPDRAAIHTLADGDMARFGCTAWRVDLRVLAPRGAIVRLNAADGATLVTGLDAGATVTQAKGEIAVENNRGALTLSNQQGPVRVSDCAGPVEVSARYGDIRLARIQDKISAQNVEGRTIIESVHGDATVRNSGGDIRLLAMDPLQGNLDLRVEKANLSVILAPESGATLTLRAVQGRVQSNVPLTGALNGDLQEFTGRMNDGRFTVLLEARQGEVALN